MKTKWLPSKESNGNHKLGKWLFNCNTFRVIGYKPGWILIQWN